MSRKANKAAIGIFVTGAIILLVTGISVFGSRMLFEKADKYVLFFDGSVKGLTTGAPVVFRGVKIGTVDQINLLYDQKIKDTFILVIIKVELSRVKGMAERIGYPDYGELIKKGLRARLELQSLVTGQLMIAFDFHPNKPAKLLGIMKQYPELPTIPMAQGVMDIVQELPLKEIANNVKETIAGINKLINSEGFRGLNDAILEITQTARSLRFFLEYLEQHPEALLKGKSNP